MGTPSLAAKKVGPHEPLVVVVWETPAFNQI